MTRVTSPCHVKSAGTSEVGLVACGHCGSWVVDLDESLRGPQKWFTQIEGPSAYLYFEIATPGAFQEMVHFLERPVTVSTSIDLSQGRSSADYVLTLGEFLGQPLAWLRDAEYADRLLIVIGGTSPSVVRISIAGEGFAELLAALRQVRDEVQEEGCRCHNAS